VTVSFRTVGAITLFVDDPQISKRWYQRTFERPVVHEDEDSAVVQFENTLVNLLRRSAAHSLIEPAAVAPSGAPATLQFTIWVDDVEAACTAVVDRGVVLLNGPMDRPWGQRTACFADPDGHVWEIAQTIG
jgi:catechol 2,3-dioxygenase-like lactoylglutathione lyase family enzyme